MTRSSDDGLDPSAPSMTVAAASAMIQARFSVVAGVETLPLSHVDNRVVAEPVLAAIDLPPFDNAAVDGYAVRFSDLSAAGPTTLPMRGRLPAGADPIPLASPAADRIFTGAAMPRGADTVIMQEDVVVTSEGVVIPTDIVRGANRRSAGEDIARGSVAIPAGRRLRPQDLALAAALGRDTLPVRCALRVAVFSTGDELTEPGERRGVSGIHDSNRVMLMALLRRLGADAHDLGILRDDPAAIETSLRRASQAHDLILTSGGVSVGEEDHVKNAVAAAGSLAFWRLAIKPGRPIAMGMVAGKPFVGLPGNPVAAYVALAFVVRPLLDRLAGAVHEEPRGFPVRAGFSLSRKPGRREFLRVCLDRGADGTPEAVLFPRRGSGSIRSLTGSDGFADLPEEACAIEPGDRLLFHPYPTLW